MTLAYDMIRRCVYCGDVVEESQPHCGEVHNELVPECPSCGEDMDYVRHDITGIETYVLQCSNCEFRTDPE